MYACMWSIEDGIIEHSRKKKFCNRIYLFHVPIHMLVCKIINEKENMWSTWIMYICRIHKAHCTIPIFSTSGAHTLVFFFDTHKAPKLYFVSKHTLCILK